MAVIAMGTARIQKFIHSTSVASGRPFVTQCGDGH
jgi:hypothetical protein